MSKTQHEAKNEKINQLIAHKFNPRTKLDGKQRWSAARWITDQAQWSTDPEGPPRAPGSIVCRFDQEQSRRIVTITSA